MKERTKRQLQVKEYRIKNGYTLEKCSRLIGISLQRVWQIEREIALKEKKNKMKHIKAELLEIRKLKYYYKQTKNLYLKKEYKQQIEESINEIKEYCGYLGYDFDAIKEKHKL